MSCVGTKGWYIAELKKRGVKKLEGKSLKTYKTHVVANLYHRVVQS